MTEPSINAQLALADARLKVLNREPISRDEYRALMLHLRQDRENAARAATSNRAAAKKIMGGGKATTAKLSLDELFPGMRATGAQDDAGPTEAE